MSIDQLIDALTALKSSALTDSTAPAIVEIEGNDMDEFVSAEIIAFIVTPGVGVVFSARRTS